MSTAGFGLEPVSRHLRGPIEEALADTRVVGIVGPRQAGKSTLARSLVAARPNATYVSLDDRRIRLAAEADPHGFVADRPGLLAVDEIQRVPDLLLAIKSVVDLDPRPGGSSSPDRPSSAPTAGYPRRSPVGSNASNCGRSAKVSSADAGRGSWISCSTAHSGWAVRAR